MGLDYFVFLLVVFQLKHLVCDYFLQTTYMLQKGNDGWGFVKPLLAHAATHGAFTLAILMLVSPGLWYLALVDMFVHFFVDRFKAGKKYLGRFQPSDKRFWWALGFDQFCHHCTHYYIIYKIFRFI